MSNFLSPWGFGREKILHRMAEKNFECEQLVLEKPGNPGNIWTTECETVPGFQTRARACHIHVENR